MTVRELINLASEQPWLLVVVFVVPPVVAFILGLGGRRTGSELGGLRYLYSVLVYTVCVPGILSAVLTSYALFFTRENLLDVNILVYLLPILSMVATLMLIRRSVAFDAIPGFSRLSGLMVMIAMTFVIILAISKTRIWVVFVGSIPMLIGLSLAIFALLSWGARMAFRGSGDPEEPPPGFPGLK